MLDAAHVSATLTDVGKYLHVTLGVPATSLQSRPWAAGKNIPFYLHDALAFFEIDLLNQVVLLAIERGSESPQSLIVQRRLDSLSRNTNGLKAVYVTTKLTAYQRMRLIKLGIPFIVPGRQLYLPPLGIDLCERFHYRGEMATQVFTPSAQAMVIVMLLAAQAEEQWRPNDLAARVGVSAMTASRALRELLTAGAVTASQSKGKQRIVRLAAGARDAWGNLQTRFRAPILSTIWYPESALTCPARFAGLDALAAKSMLSPPSYRVYAVDHRDWAKMDQSIAVPEPDVGMVEVQVWRYPPTLESGSQYVDPLSLALSLSDDKDDRVQASLETMLGSLPCWERGEMS